MRTFAVLVLACSLSSPLHAAVRDAHRGQLFIGLHEADQRASVSGSVEGHSVSLFESPNYVTGTGPHGPLSITIYGTSASGNSGSHFVNLRISNGWVSGQGYHGPINLHQYGASITGNVGTQRVSVTESNGWASGTFGGSSVTLSAFGSTTPSLIEILLASF